MTSLWPTSYLFGVYGPEEPCPKDGVISPFYAQSTPYIPSPHENAFIPADAITYTFVQSSPIAIHITAVASSARRSPLATITVGVGHIASDGVSITIGRGNTEIPIGHFALGRLGGSSTVTINGATRDIDSVLTCRRSDQSESRFYWSFDDDPSHQFVWKYDYDGSLICTRNEPTRPPSPLHPSLPLAILGTRMFDPSGSHGPTMHTTLELSPQAHAPPLLAHVLLSTVMIERRRRWRSGPQTCMTRSTSEI